jgi:hypothetical protein
MRARPTPRPRSWSSEWIAQSTGRCTTCGHARSVMLIEDGAPVCEGCHQTRLEQWRCDDIDAERREALWDAWTIAADRWLG